MVRSTVQKSFALFLFVALAGCARLEISKSNLGTHVQLNALRPGAYETKTHFHETRWIHYFIFQLTPTARPNLDEILKPHVQPGDFITDFEVRKKRTFVNGFICAFIGIIYCPETLTLDGNVVAKKAEPPPMDSDNDGVVDSLDKCGGTGASAKVDPTGCPVTIDLDTDGVTDDEDWCPATRQGSTVDIHGCPVDTDEDGVSDEFDKCPNTPSRTEVNEAGCPKVAKEEPPKRAKGVLKGVSFEKNSAKLTQSSSKVLDDVAQMLKAFPNVKIEVQGHTDDAGNKNANLKLSQKRAQAVVDFFIKKGVRKSRLIARGYGVTKPIADNKTAEGRQANRRVELKWLDQ